jgi:sRNA-binding carbon storage regulator CsrA
MLSLQQKVNDSIFIFDNKGNEIGQVKLLEICNHNIKIGFEIDKDYTILREKVLREKLVRMGMESNDFMKFLKKEND